MKSTLLLLCLFGIVGCQPNSPTVCIDPPEVDLEQDFSHWPSVTEKPRLVPMDVYERCEPTSQEEIERYRKLYPKGHGPHDGGMIIVRVSPESMELFRQHKAVPVGTVVVKEKHRISREELKKPEAIGFMIKREAGYDPKYGDWEYGYLKYQEDGKKELTRGRLTSCIDCHSYASDRDHLYRTYLLK
jgi:hypothetical protein